MSGETDWRSTLVGGSLRGQSCVRRELSSCAAIFLDPKYNQEEIARYLTSAVPELWEVTGVHVHHLPGVEHQLLTDLEAEFGQDRFARFWTSSLAVPEAFEEAFGLAPDRWLQGWVRRHYFSGPSGAELVEAGAIAVVLLLGSIVAALRTVRRRSVA
jgi:hypothetical protein